MRSSFNLWQDENTVSWDDCNGINEDVDEEQEEERYERMIEEHERERNKAAEEKAFRENVGQGVHAPAFRDDLDTLEMIRLRQEGYSLRRIAKKLECSPSTVRNRINRFNLHR